MPSMSAVERGFCRSAPWSSITRRVVLPWALPGVNLSGDVLEMGGGSGVMAEAMARRFPEARITTTDIDPAMIQSARRRLRQVPSAIAQEADTTSLPFSDATFDHVVSFLMLHHVIEWRQALQEAGRVLRPGGQLHGYDLTDSPVTRAIHWADRSPYQMIAPAAFEPALGELGFASVNVRRSFGSQIVRFAAKTARDDSDVHS